MFSKALDLIAGALWAIATKVEDVLAHRHDSKRLY